ncbi:hypothetical protein AR1Y2_1884 [Anaerostipes rhamnosivorans]|uniref:Uncharacterized protein n=1 Tax=Anaerostipes rhamnosivorans TaxID=1229621 RepID=A0A4P8ICG3_9FIRM|nr:hypothetical protein AR1Y2_1884 [Anaerostipes rhamnosivorans]
MKNVLKEMNLGIKVIRYSPENNHNLLLHSKIKPCIFRL